MRRKNEDDIAEGIVADVTRMLNPATATEPVAEEGGVIESNTGISPGERLIANTYQQIVGMNPATALDFAKKLMGPKKNADLTEITRYMFEGRILPEDAAKRAIDYWESDHLSNGSPFMSVMAAYHKNSRIPTKQATEILLAAQGEYKAGNLKKAKELLAECFNMPAKTVKKDD